MDHKLQEMASAETLDSMLVICSKAAAVSPTTMSSGQQAPPPQQQQEKKPRPPDEALNCPRCDSTNTKFCYYNNYSLSQPRYFCKACRRYWTKGGTLRNVPVGGGCRKNKRSPPSSSSSSSSSSMLQEDRYRKNDHNSLIATAATTAAMSNNHHPMLIPTLFPNLPYHHDHSNSCPANSTTTTAMTMTTTSACSELSLAFARLQRQMGIEGVGGGFEFEDKAGGSHHGVVSILGNIIPSNAQFENDIIMGMSHDHLGALNSIRGNGDCNFLDHNHNHHHHHDQNTPSDEHHDHGLGINMYGGGTIQLINGGDDHGEMMGSMNHDDHLVMKYTPAVTHGSVKQEVDQSGISDQDQGRILWGLPWQINAAAAAGGGGGSGAGGGIGDHVDAAMRGSWINNGLVGSPWHGLVQSSLM